MVKKIVVSTTLVVLCALVGGAQNRPNFTGEWAINTAKSDFGQLPAPGAFVYRIEHDGAEIRMITTAETPMGETTVEVTCVIGGDPCSIKDPVGTTRGVARWEGETLVLDLTTDIQGQESKRAERMSLSADGNVLTVRSALGGVTGEMQLTVVLDRK